MGDRVRIIRGPFHWTISGILLGAGGAWYVAVEARWFMLHAGVGRGEALARVIATLFVGAVLFVLIALAMASFIAPA